MRFTEKARKLIEQRARGRCELCDAPAQTAQIHHRKPRGMGGTKNPASRSPSNGLYVHFKCHEWIERNREQAALKGYLVPQWADSDTTPVLFGSSWYLLLPDGTKTKVEVARDSEGKPVPRFPS